MKERVPPPESWKRGQSADHDIVVVEVLVQRDSKTGRVYSAHRLSDADREVVLSWPSGGLEQVAHALLTEAVRREAILDLVLQASLDGAFVEKWRDAPTEKREALIQQMAVALRVQMDGTVARLAEAALREGFEQLSTTPGE